MKRQGLVLITGMVLMILLVVMAFDLPAILGMRGGLGGPSFK